MLTMLSLSAVIYFTASGGGDTHRTNAGQKACNLAKSEINNSLAMLDVYYPRTTSR
jgi:hypothetical protein